MHTAIDRQTHWCPVDVTSDNFKALARLSPVPLPESCLWLGGSRIEGQLDAVIGFNPFGKGVWVYIALCKVTVQGKRALYDLLKAFRWIYSERDISFAVDISNRQAMEIVKRMFPGAVPTAQVWTDMAPRKGDA